MKKFRIKYLDILFDKKINKKNIVGIIFDGIKVAYQYELENDVIGEGPYNLENTNFSDLLDKLVSGLTEPKAFKSDNLIEDFGYNSKNYINTIETIYDLAIKQRGFNII